MSNTFGKSYRFTVFGESHAPEIGVCVEGLPAGIRIDTAALQAFLGRRAPGKNEYSTARREPDKVLFTEGLGEDGLTTGAPLKAVIRNTDVRSADYDAFRSAPRPGHADYPAYVKTGRIAPGGGKWSGRLTAPLCIAGGIAKQLLEAEGIKVFARIESIGGVHDPGPFTESLEGEIFPVSSKNPLTAKRFEEKIAAAKAAGDSVGGTVECCVTGLPVGLGEHPFGGLENRIAEAVFGIPAVKGIEFGDGFALSALHGSEANDAYRYEDGRVVTKTNHCGGVLGGMANGMPLIFRVAFKPTPTIGKEQESVDLLTGENVTVQGKGRHDPCIVPRAVPVVEAAAAAALYDRLLTEREEAAQASGKKSQKEPSPMALETLRLAIDEADQALLPAFLKRMEAAEAIAAYKKERGLPVFDAAREEALLERIKARTPKEMQPYAQALYETLLRLSRERQEEQMS
ncbi:MAG: chorismate synthase [Lachnospiraceae bacterium]|nr:chorismate synthase [Lachnospiraceae bacterium]